MVNPAAQRPRFLAPGDKLGKYELIRQIAVGGMAELYLARTLGIEGFEKLVVVKRILPQFANNASFVNMFLNEARLAATLHHPNIAQVYDIGQEGHEYFFAMEYIHGEDLGRMVASATDNGVPISLDVALTLVAGLCAGLHYAHDKVANDGKPLNVVHRDVSPSNVLVSYDGAVKLVDFGIARAGSQPSTTRGGIKGKIGYMSPEQCRGKEVLDRRSDIFSVGAILFELTTGRQPFEDETEYGVLSQIVNNDAQPPSRLVPGFPPALDKIVLRALARDRDKRYPTAIELQGDIEDFAHDNRLRISPLVLARLMGTLFPARLEEWDHARAQGAFFVEQHVVRTLIESGKTSDSAVALDAAPPTGLGDSEDTSVSAPPLGDNEPTNVQPTPAPELQRRRPPSSNADETTTIPDPPRVATPPFAVAAPPIGALPPTEPLPVTSMPRPMTPPLAAMPHAPMPTPAPMQTRTPTPPPGMPDAYARVPTPSAVARTPAPRGSMPHIPNAVPIIHPGTLVSSGGSYGTPPAAAPPPVTTVLQVGDVTERVRVPSSPATSDTSLLAAGGPRRLKLPIIVLSGAVVIGVALALVIVKSDKKTAAAEAPAKVEMRAEPPAVETPPAPKVEDQAPTPTEKVERSPTIDKVAEPTVEPKVEPKGEPKIEPKVEPTVDTAKVDDEKPTKTTPKSEPKKTAAVVKKVEPKKVEPKKAEPKKVEPKKTEPKVELKTEPKPEPKVEVKTEPKPEPKPEPKEPKWNADSPFMPVRPSDKK